VLVDDLPPWFLRVLAFAFGLIWGSFLNVVIHRVPRGLSLVRPGSTCPACGKPIRAWHNIPLFGYLFLRGKASCCGARVSPRYPLVEAIGGVLALAILESVVFRLGPTLTIERGLAIFVADLALALALTAAAFIDLEHMYLPDSITIGGAILGAAAGFGIVWIPFVVLYSKIRGKVGMGMGDAKLLALAGAWFGWGGALIVLGAGAIQGTIATLAVLLFRGKIEEPEAVKREREEIQKELEAMSPEDRAAAEKELAEDPLSEEAGEGVGQARIAFGPFLILATIECLLLGRDVPGLFLAWIDAP
jgi:leader peptidase (prepilin peptidase)/N-methyltransferase